MHKNPNQPIGIFDSGIGGLTVANAIHHFLPNERLIYFGDTVHLPYGDKSADAIRYYCLRISKFLLEQDCKMIVIACNSASSAAYDMLLDFFEGKVLFVNVVDPLVQAVVSEGYKNVGFAHFNYINPMPKNTEEILSKFKKILVCELNSGQFASILKIKHSKFEFLQFNKVQGLPFANDDLIQKFKELV